VTVVIKKQENTLGSNKKGMKIKKQRPQAPIPNRQSRSLLQDDEFQRTRRKKEKLPNIETIVVLYGRKSSLLFQKEKVFVFVPLLGKMMNSLKPRPHLLTVR